MSRSYRHHRTLSYSEINTALTCQAQWDFSYGGRLAGSTLKPKRIAPTLSRGSAWGAMMAAWHASGDTLFASLDASTAMRESLDRDWRRMEEAGALMIGVLDQRVEIEAHLWAMFMHQVSIAEPLGNLTRLEDDMFSPIPARTGSGRGSSLYRFQARIDGFLVDRHGHEWVWECKLRDKLTPRAMVAIGRQYLWYAWSRQRETGRPVVGVIVEERLNEAPKPPRIVQAKRKGEGIDGMTVSHATNQVTTPELYREACAKYGVDPDPEAETVFGQRDWTRRHLLHFSERELGIAGRELVSAAEMIRDLDRGRYPLRIGKAQVCNGCRFKSICADPLDRALVDLSFTRGTPKRDKSPVTA